MGVRPTKIKTPSAAKLPRGPGLHVLQADPLDQIETLDRLDDGVPGEFDLLVCQGAFLEDRRGPEAVPPVDDRHLLREAGEVEGLLDRRIAPADDRDLPVSVEGAVAGGAEGDPLPDEPLLTGHAEAPPVRPRGDDHGKRPVAHRAGGDLPAVPVAEPFFRHRRHVAGGGLETELDALRLEALGEIEAVDPLRDPRVVLDEIGDGDLAHRRFARDCEHPEVRAGGVHPRGQPRRPAADDDDIVGGIGNSGFCHDRFSFFVRWG